MNFRSLKVDSGEHPLKSCHIRTLRKKNSFLASLLVLASWQCLVGLYQILCYTGIIVGGLYCLFGWTILLFLVGCTAIVGGLYRYVLVDFKFNFVGLYCYVLVDSSFNMLSTVASYLQNSHP